MEKYNAIVRNHNGKLIYNIMATMNLNQLINSSFNITSLHLSNFEQLKSEELLLIFSGLKTNCSEICFSIGSKDAYRNNKKKKNLLT